MNLKADRTLRRGLIVLLALATLFVATPACSGTSGPGSRLPLTTLAELPLPGRATRWDYASPDEGHHLLFLAHLGDSAVVVFDTARRKVVATIPDISSVHGVLYVPELDRVYASATGTDEVVAIDAETFKIIARAGRRLSRRHGLCPGRAQAVCLR